MEIKPIEAKIASQYIKQNQVVPDLFLQTPSWLNFQIKVGRSGEHLGIYKAGELVGVATAIFHKLERLGWHYAYLPRGPLVAEKYLKDCLTALQKYYQARGFIFLRVEPALISNQAGLLPVGFKRSADVQPAATTVLDLGLSISELLNQMHAKTRYNIRLAEKKDLIWELVGAAGWEDFWRLLQITAQRDGITTFAKSYYQSLVDLYVKEPLEHGPELAVRLAQVKYQGQVLAMSMLLFSREAVVYLHGASSDEQRSLMPTYLLHWRNLQQAKQLGYKYYDWRGVAVKGVKQEAWQGITRFKLGWGGRVIEYIGTYDLVYKKWLYAIYIVVSKIKRMI